MITLFFAIVAATAADDVAIRFPRAHDVVFLGAAPSTLPLTVALRPAVRSACVAGCRVCIGVHAARSSAEEQRAKEGCFDVDLAAETADPLLSTLAIDGLTPHADYVARVRVVAAAPRAEIARAESSFRVGDARSGLRAGETLVHRACHVFCRVEAAWIDRRPVRAPCAGIATARGERVAAARAPPRCAALHRGTERGATLGLAWQVGGPFGWAILGENLAAHLLELGVDPLPLSAVNELGALRPARARALAPQVARAAALMANAWQHCGDPVHEKLLLPFPIVFSLGEDFGQVSRPDEFGRFFSSVANGNIGLAFLESAALRPALAAVYDGPLFVGSAWNADVARGATGRRDVYVFTQGVDPLLFHVARPAHARRRGGDGGGSAVGGGVFSVFSGGKLELRKGQDIAVAAFREFSARVRAREPSARLELVTSWHHAWSELVDIELALHARSRPGTRSNGTLLLGAWLEEHGVRAAEWRNVGVTPHDEMAAVLHAVDVALFPNRCEGGLNLVAMEALACGTPTVLSRNTGHRDLIDAVEGATGSYPIATQRDVVVRGEATRRDAWGESDVGEVADALEAVYYGRADAKQRGRFASQRIRTRFSWLACAADFVGVLRRRGLLVPRLAATAAAAAAAL
jgi:glycosyltransferase involved in cell wall biosynthesis